jgi:hypothetical protein
MSELTNEDAVQQKLVGAKVESLEGDNSSHD